MDIGGIIREAASRATAISSTLTPAQQPAVPVEDTYDPLVDRLTTLKRVGDQADDDAKARAKQKLDDAKEQLKFLQRWGFDPKVVAQQAAVLGVVVAGAAREFTSALTENGAALLTSGANTAAAGRTDGSPDEATPDASSDDISNDADTAGSQAQRAYMDTMHATPAAEKPKLSADDFKTATEFSTVANQIKALLEEAVRRLRDQNSSAAGASSSTQTLDAAVSALIGTVSTMPAASITI